MKKLFLPVFICIFAFSFVYATEIQADISKNLVRMHIIANSDSEYDQNIKFFVRNELLKNIDATCDIAMLEDVANQALSKTNAKYIAAASAERCYVPQKDYKNIRLPEGIYNCVKVVLGDGKGENWWCIAYPPLCFTEEVFGEMSEDAKHQLEDILDKDSLDAIVKSGNVNFRFKIVELVQKLRFL